MKQSAKTCLVFRSTAFNTSEPKEYFINECCFGDDLARWLMVELRSKGYSTVGEPGQEDFGWYFTFEVEGVKHDAVIGHRPISDDGESEWLCWIERTAGLLGSLAGRRNDIDPQAVQVLQSVLQSSPLITDVQLCFDHEL